MEKVALIIAGGIGSRLWPISTQTKSKQFINLYNDETLIQNTIKRINKIIPYDNIYIVGSINQKEELYKIKNINKSNILLEPKQNKTACAIYYGITKIYKKYKECIISIFPSDHYIENEKEFIKGLNESFEDNDKITILGIKPSKPDPKFGYLLGQNNLKSFIEKPNTHIAKKLIKKNALWSIGIYIGNINTFRTIYKKYLNNIFTEFEHKSKIETKYNNIEGVSFEKEIIEHHPEYFKAKEVNINWMDVGSYEGLDKVIKKDKNKNNLNNIYYKSTNCTLLSTEGKKIYAVGINDIMLIENESAILIVKKNMYNKIDKLKENIK